MKSFEHGYLLDTPLGHSLGKSLRVLGEYRGRQDMHTDQSPEILETLRQVAMIQSAESSNRIEGIIVSPNRLAPLVTGKTKPQDRSEQEVSGYRDVLADIHTNHSRMKLTTGLILDWHRRMYRYTPENGGHWKSKDNAILEIKPGGQAAVRFKPVSALAAPEFMEKLLEYYQKSLDEEKVDALLLVASFILDFECIHPFMDGNGRLGRLLTLLLLYQQGFEVGRYISLERVVEQSKESYYETLLKSSKDWHAARHDTRPWWEYFLGMLTAAYDDFEARMGSITSAKGAKREMVQNAVTRLSQQFKFGDLQKACPGVSYPTLKRALSDLKGKGLIRCLGKGRDALWERIESTRH